MEENIGEPFLFFYVYNTNPDIQIFLKKLNNCRGIMWKICLENYILMLLKVCFYEIKTENQTFFFT